MTDSTAKYYVTYKVAGFKDEKGNDKIFRVGPYTMKEAGYQREDIGSYAGVTLLDLEYEEADSPKS